MTTDKHGLRSKYLTEFVIELVHGGPEESFVEAYRLAKADSWLPLYVLARLELSAYMRGQNYTATATQLLADALHTMELASYLDESLLHTYKIVMSLYRKDAAKALAFSQEINRA